MYYLMKQEKALAEMQDIQVEIANHQDCYQPENDRWFSEENKDKDYIKHCDSLLNDKPF